MHTLKLVILLFAMLAAALPAAAQQGTASQEQSGSLIVLPEVFQRANEAATSGDLDQALIDYSLFLLLNPTFSQGYFSRSLTYQALGDDAQALLDLNRALAYRSPGPEYTAAVLLNRAQLYLNDDDIDSALADLDASISAYPQGVDSLSLRARIYLFQDEFDAALTDYNSLIELNPTEPNHLIERAFVHVRQGQIEEALDDYSRAISLNPDNAQPYIERGFILAQTGDAEAALSDYDRAIELSPNDDSYYMERALFHRSLEHFNDALADMDSAIDLNPRNGSYYLMRGTINASAENVADAADDYLRWMVLNRTQSYSAPETLTNSGTFTVEMAAGRVFSIPFAASEGQTVTIAANGITSQPPVDPLLVVLDTVGDPLVGDDDSGGNMDAAIRNFTIPLDGEYILLVSHAAGGGVGNINVSFDLGE
jgi:tetratricopeptide (TPR) repeat protein